MRVRQVMEGVFEISLAWSNVYLLTDGKEATLIDTGLRQDRDDLLAAIRQVGLEPGQVRSVLLTHGHCDHAGNAIFLRRPTRNGTGGAKLYAHAAEARYLQLPRFTYAPKSLRTFLRPFTSLAFIIGETLYPVERGVVDVTLEEGQLVATPIGPLRVLHCPGHTPGQVAYLRERDDLLFSGDVILTIVPVWRKPGLCLPMPLFTDNMAQARRSARRLVELRPSVLLSGHGWPLTEHTAERLREWAKTL